MAKQFLIHVVLMVSLVSPGAVPAFAGIPQEPPPALSAGEPGVENLLASDEGLHFRLRVPAYQVDQQGQATAAGLAARTRQPGAPNLPYFTTLILLPPEATATVAVQASGATEAVVPALSFQPYPASPSAELGGQPVQIGPELTDLGQVVVQYLEDPAIYGQDAFYPAALYALSEPFYYRDLRLVRLALFPLQYNPVSGHLRHSPLLDVQVQFHGPQNPAALRPLASSPATGASLAPLVLNAGYLEQWRSLPSSFQASGTVLPIGQETYKIELNEDGIYEITGQMLANAGMDIASVDPHTLHMMYRGQPVAYEYVGNPDDGFDSSDAVRFYGWAFAGSRLEAQYITNNVFWIWAGDTPSTIANSSNPSGYPLATSYPSSATAEPELLWYSTWSDQWDTFPNEPDAWFWDRTATGNVTVYNVTVPHPAPTGPDAMFTAEMTSRADLSNLNQHHQVEITMNDHPNIASGDWNGKVNINLTSTVPIETVISGTNTFTMTTIETRYIYFNRITVDYMRRFVVDGDQLKFENPVPTQSYELGPFHNGTLADVRVWNITDPLQPANVPMSAGNIINNGGTYSYTFGSNSAGTFLVTHLGQKKTPLAITQYIPPDLDPPTGQADWLAITHRDLYTATLPLAAHRADPLYGGLRTHIVPDVQDILNEYGYGLPLPSAIRDYLAYALDNWTVAPTYVVLVGDASMNPRNLDCTHPACNSWWDPDTINYVPTNLAFEDPFQGLIPSDEAFTFATNDLAPDFAIGRITAKVPADVTTIINKIILYETNQMTPAEWQRTFLFMADAFDPDAGDFCHENQILADSLPPSMNSVVDELCLISYDPDDIAALRTTLSDYVNMVDQGAMLLNYRGHGGLTDWGDVSFFTTGDTGFWLNGLRPLVILSADCLDGYFALNGIESLSETFLRIPAASAAHWSSSGLGTTDDHTALELEFYAGIFSAGNTAIGNATVYAKLAYLATIPENNDSLLYTFTLQGDPAMQLIRPEMSLDKSALQTEASPGDQVSFALEVSNGGLLPVQPTLNDTLPAALTFVQASATTPITVTSNGNQVTIELDGDLAWGDSASVTLVTQVDPNLSETQALVNQASLSPFGLDLQPGDESDTASVTVTVGGNGESTVYFYLPYLAKDG